jgi:hypothetical protein
MTQTQMEQRLDELAGGVNTAERNLTLVLRQHDERRRGIEEGRAREKRELRQALTAHPNVDQAKELELHDSVTRARLDGHDSDANVLEAERQAANAAQQLDEFARRVKVTLPTNGPELPDAHRSRASSLMPLVQAEVGSASLTSLAGSLKRALQEEDHAAAWCFAATIPTRLANEAKNATTDELRSLVSRVRSDLTPKTKHPLDRKADQARSGASRVAFKASDRKRKTEKPPFQVAYEALHPGQGPMVNRKQIQPEI